MKLETTGPIARDKKFQEIRKEIIFFSHYKSQTSFSFCRRKKKYLSDIHACTISACSSKLYMNLREYLANNISYFWYNIKSRRVSKRSFWQQFLSGVVFLLSKWWTSYRIFIRLVKLLLTQYRKQHGPCISSSIPIYYLISLCMYSGTIFPPSLSLPSLFPSFFTFTLVYRYIYIFFRYNIYSFIPTHTYIYVQNVKWLWIWLSEFLFLFNVRVEGRLPLLTTSSLSCFSVVSGLVA